MRRRRGIMSGEGYSASGEGYSASGEDGYPRPFRPSPPIHVVLVSFCLPPFAASLFLAGDMGGGGGGGGGGEPMEHMDYFETSALLITFIMIGALCVCVCMSASLPVAVSVAVSVCLCLCLHLRLSVSVSLCLCLSLCLNPCLCL